MALFAPIGPISIALEGVRLCTLLPPPLLPLEFSPGYNPLLVIIIVISFKFLIYVYLRRTKVAGKSTPLILSIATLATCIISTLAWWYIAVLPASLVVTISMDLTVFSYVKYRDALNGMASREWILVLPILWSLMIWSPIIYSRKWLDWIEHMFSPIPIAIIIAVWTTITIVQLALAIKYYKAQ